MDEAEAIFRGVKATLQISGVLISVLRIRHQDVKKNTENKTETPNPLKAWSDTNSKVILSLLTFYSCCTGPPSSVDA